MMKQELVSISIQKPSQILRQTTLQQCYGRLDDGQGKYCALGAISIAMGRSVRELIEILPYGAADKIRIMNDKEEKTFSEIAYWLEERGL